MPGSSITLAIVFGRIVFFLFLSLFGGLAISTGFREWRDDPVRDYRAGDGIVSLHELVLDQNRWNERVPLPLRVDTQVRLEAGSSCVAREFFGNSDSARSFMDAKPPGSQAALMISSDQHEARWRSLWPHRGLGLVAFGVLLVLFALHRLLDLPWPTIQPELAGVLFCAAFLVAGLVAASKMWPAAVRRIQAAHWEPVVFELLGTRTVPSGKHSRTEHAIRYSFGDATFVTVQSPGGMSFDSGQDLRRECRVDPARPWQVEIAWGWTPGLGVVLFPVPFLTVGVLALIIPFSSRLRKIIRVGSSNPRGEQFAPHDTSGIGPSLFALIFVGSIVGVFGSLCGEMWIHDQPMKWFLTLFLLPFVGWVVWLFRCLIRSLMKAWQNRANQ